MAVKGVNALTLADWAKRTDPNGKVDKIVELLSQTNEILTDMMFVEGNLPTGHRTTVRSGLPSATWRLLNYGVQPSKSTTVQVTDSCGMLETYAEVDKSLADLNGNTAEFRLSEDRAFIEGMNQQMAQTLFYGDMRASGLTAWSDAHKRAYGVTMMGSLGDVVTRTPDLKSLSNDDFRILKSKGITDTDWSVWKLAQQEDWGKGNDTMLTPESIMRIPDAAVEHLGSPERVKFEAMRKLLGAVTEEVDMAVITPGAREQMVTGSGIQRGTWKGELTRSVFLFKSFPISVVMRHWSRAMGMPSAGGRAAYIATFIASTTILGALSQQLNDIASGRNPRDMAGEDAAKFWLGALLKGGGLGLYGDFLLSDHTRYGSGALASMLGPVAGLVDDVIKIGQGIPLNAVEGKSEQTGGDLVKLGKGLTPGANIWYLKAALDHMIFNQMQEYFSPGYLRKMEQRSKKEFNQTYWWRPQDVTPQ